MRHEKGVLDTSAVLRLHELEPDDLPKDAAITTVTLAKLSAGPLLAQDDGVRAARSFAQIAADLRRSGRKPAARAFDALIAATAKAVGLPLHIFDADDFRGVTGLEIVALPAERRA